MLCWTMHVKGPKRDGHTAVAVGHRVYSFGVYYGENQIEVEVHVFNTVSLRWTTLPPMTIGRGQGPPGRKLKGVSRAVLIEDIIYIWGGPYCNNIYAFDVEMHTWSKPEVSGTVPEAREGHSACALEKAIFVYGGWTTVTGRLSDVYKLDTTTMIWTLIDTTRGTTPAPARAHHSATIIGTKMFVFGGPGVYDNLIRVFDTETNCWLSTPPSYMYFIPEKRWGHSAFAYGGELYICGGFSWGKDLNDLWRFSPETFTWKKVVPKGKRPCWTPGMCCCMLGDCVILFKSDLFVLDLGPSLKTLCKLAVIQHGLEQSQLPHSIRWELATMTAESK